MLLSSYVGCPPVALSGTYGIQGIGAPTPQELLTKSKAISELQKALTILSQATRNPGIDPGSTNGLDSGTCVTQSAAACIPDRTMAAVAASISLIGPKLGKWLSAALAIALGVGASTQTAKQFVLDNAGELRAAALAAAAAAPYYVGPEQPAEETTPAIFSTSGPWYLTWWGIGSMAVGAAGLIALLVSRRG